MASHTEIELKWALTPAAHAALGRRLAAELGPPHPLAQENRFFDAADGRLRRGGLSVRLRREGERLLLTCKRRLSRSHGAHRHDEWERDIDLRLWQGLDQPGLRDRLPLPPHILEALAGAELSALGGFANQRLEFHHGGVLEALPLEEKAERDSAASMARPGPERGPAELLCLDRTDLGGRIDHELEIETPDPKASAAYWTQRLQEWGIAWEPQGKTKLARYLELRGREPQARG